MDIETIKKDMKKRVRLYGRVCPEILANPYRYGVINMNQVITYEKILQLARAIIKESEGEG